MNMHFLKGTITNITKESEDIFTIRVQPEIPYVFISGQYCALQIPGDTRISTPHFFSIASPQKSTKSLEFCIRTYGEWTSSLVKLAAGSTVEISDPLGSFELPKETVPLVFLVGGVGIVPVISMLRHLRQHPWEHPITLLYGNRTPETILYKSELEQIQKDFPLLKLVHILSEQPLPGHKNTYQGFITKSILSSEIDFSVHPLFYLNGPPVFIEKMKVLLQELQISQQYIVTES